MKTKIMKNFMMLAWACILLDTDSYYVPYLFLAVLSFVCFSINSKSSAVITLEKTEQIFTRAVAIVYSIVVLLANYRIWYEVHCPEGIFGYVYKIILFITLGVGGFYIAYNILRCAAEKLENFFWQKKVYQISPQIIFISSFVIISTINIGILITCEYPGNLTRDSFVYIDEMVNGISSNYQPAYHALIVKVVMTIGLKLFADMNAAVAFYSVFQIFFISACFSIVVYTLYEINISLHVVIIVMLWYILMPFHITYSYTMWKDVWWAGFVTLWIVYMFRILRKIGNNRLFNFGMLFLSGLGVCLFRSNGFFVFIFTFIIFLILMRRKEKKVCSIMLGTAMVGFIMKYIILGALGITQADSVEALSIPLQQIARVVVDHNDFTEEERVVLDQTMDVNAIPEVYKPYISDPIKDLVRERAREKGAMQSSGRIAFAKLYVKLGLKHPVTYVKAWIDQTRGYWNAGYSYWRWGNYIFENEYGIKKIIHSGLVKNFFDKYLWIFENNRLLQIFLCIGFYVWISFFMCFISIIRKDKVGVIISMPIIMTILSLLISTPVFAEFRYAYAIFCALPFVMIVPFNKDCE